MGQILPYRKVAGRAFALAHSLRETTVASQKVVAGGGATCDREEASGSPWSLGDRVPPSLERFARC